MQLMKLNELKINSIKDKKKLVQETVSDESCIEEEDDEDIIKMETML